ncbi:MAG: tetratricopeptide repeat protein [Litorimonas sp.]
MSLFAFACMLPASVSAQSSNAAQAKDAYFAAQSLYDSGKYDDALAKLDEAKRLRGATDAYFLALRARIELGREAYHKTTEALIAFNKEAPSADLVDSMRKVRIAADVGLAKKLALWTEECAKSAGWACTNMGISYHNIGYGRYSTDNAIAATFYERGCDAGNGLGCTKLGFMAEKADGVEKDDVRARELYRKGCDAKNALGCANHGYFMQFGLGGPTSGTSAAEFYGKGCDGGEGRGCHNLALLYRKENSGVTVDLPKASELMRKSCRLGYTNACGLIEG